MEDSVRVEVATVSSGEGVSGASSELPRNELNSGQSSSLINSLLSTLTAQPKSTSSNLPEVPMIEQLQQLFPIPIQPLVTLSGSAGDLPPPTVVASQASSEPPQAPPPPPPATTASTALVNSDLTVVPREPTTSIQPPPELMAIPDAPCDSPSPSLLDAPGPAVEQQDQAETRVSPPSLHANEEMLSEDSEEEEMDSRDTPTIPNDASPAISGPSLSSTSLVVSSASLVVPTTSSAPTSVHSDPASPNDCDDDSFADFVAKEALTNALEDHSHSPTPNPSHLSLQSSSGSSDIHALLNHLHRQSPAAEGSSALISQFGVTASCPPTPVQLPEGAVPAPLDMTAKNFPKRSKYAHRAAISAMHPYNRTSRGGGTSVAKTLDLLKAVLQPSFNQEVKRLCDDYLQIFTLAAGNIRENTRDNVPEATLRVLVHKMMEEAQIGYANGKWEFPTGKLPRNEKILGAKSSPMASKKVKTDRNETKYGPPKRARKAPVERHSEKASGWKWGMDKKRLDPVKWEPEKLTCEIDFVLGVNVNKALGHAANRGKVYYLHPELFKYACDGDDKTWLYENKHLPVHGGKAFLMIFDEVEALIKKDDFYKDSADVWLAVKKLQKFHVPQFMVDKMKYFMQSVQGYFAQEAKDGNSSSKS